MGEVMRRAKFVALHADTIGRVDAPEQAALVIGDDLEERQHAVPPSRADMQQMPFTSLARHRGELLPPGWEHAAPAWGVAGDSDGMAAARLREADVNAISDLLLARLRRKARDLSGRGPVAGQPRAVWLDARRHARLQAVAMRRGRTCDELIAEAIDGYLATAAAEDDETHRA